MLGCLWHQGSIYPQTAHAVPFLVALSVPNRSGWRKRAMSVVVAIAAASGGGDPISKKVREAFAVSRPLLEKIEDADWPFGASADYAIAAIEPGERDDPNDLIQALEEEDQP
jgi:hypothetical protein